MNWKNLISDLIANGYGYTTIGRCLTPHRTGPGIRALHKGIASDPAWGVGQQLIALHKKSMRKANRVKA